MGGFTKWPRFVGLAILLLFWLFTGFMGIGEVSAQIHGESGILLGVITGNGNTVIAGAEVHLRNTMTEEVFKSHPLDDIGFYLLRKIPFGKYDLAVKTVDGFYLTAESVVVDGPIPQSIAINLILDKAAAATMPAAPFWSSPVGIAIASVAVVATGFIIADQTGEEIPPESPFNP